MIGTYTWYVSIRLNSQTYIWLTHQHNSYELWLWLTSLSFDAIAKIKDSYYIFWSAVLSHIRSMFPHQSLSLSLLRHGFHLNTTQYWMAWAEKHKWHAYRRPQYKYLNIPRALLLFGQSPVVSHNRLPIVIWMSSSPKNHHELNLLERTMNFVCVTRRWINAFLANTTSTQWLNVVFATTALECLFNMRGACCCANKVPSQQRVEWADTFSSIVVRFIWTISSEL